MSNDLSVVAALKRAAEICGGQASLAEQIGVKGASPRATVWAWSDRARVPLEYCAEIERATSGAVTRRDLRPDDWHRIWPELVTPEHPAPAPAPAEQGA